MSGADIRDDFDNWFFTTNKTTNECPSINSKCIPPKACSRDPNTGQSFCCDSGEKTVCWRGATQCKTDGSTLSCGSGSTSWCCLAKSEKCTERPGQINICWSTGQNTLKQISVPDLEAAYSSLSSSRPSLTTLAFVPSRLIAATRTSASGSNVATATATSDGGAAPATSESATSSGTSSPATGGSVSGSSDTGLAPGAIAGMVVGLVLGLAVVGLSGFFLWKWIKKRDSARGTQPETGELDGSSPPPPPQHIKSVAQSYGYHHIADTPASGGVGMAEVGDGAEAQHNKGFYAPVELDGSGKGATGTHVSELAGDWRVRDRNSEKTLSVGLPR